MSINHEIRFAKYEELLKNSDQKVHDLENALNDKTEENEKLEEKIEFINEESVTYRMELQELKKEDNLKKAIISNYERIYGISAKKKLTIENTQNAAKNKTPRSPAVK